MVYSDDNGNYSCTDCGNRWQAGERFLWWPVRIRWFWRTWGLSAHGVQVGWDGIERCVYQRVISIGPLRIVMGKGRP